MNLKKLSLIFFISLILNAIWENLHVFLYDNYMGGEITEFILLRASIADAIIITTISIPFLYFSFLQKRPWLIIILGMIIGIFNEWYGLGTGRWMYNAHMPIIPLINVGLTPAIQLGLIGFLSFKLCYNKSIGRRFHYYVTKK